MHREECIKFPECLGCDRVITIPWEVTGGQIRVCKVYNAPRHYWRRGGCPVREYQVTELGAFEKGSGHVKRKDAAYLTKRGRVAT